MASFGLGHPSHWHIFVIEHVLLLVAFDQVLASVLKPLPCDFVLCSQSHKKSVLASLPKRRQSWLLQTCFLPLPSCRKPEGWTRREKLSTASTCLAMNLLFPSVYLGVWQMFTHKDWWGGLFRKIWSGVWTTFIIGNILQDKLMNCLAR